MGRQVYVPRYLRFAAFPSQNLSHHLPPDCLQEATHLSMADAFGAEVLWAWAAETPIAVVPISVRTATAAKILGIGNLQ
jgi:hypothetical protein